MIDGLGLNGVTQYKKRACSDRERGQVQYRSDPARCTLFVLLARTAHVTVRGR